MQSDLVIIMLGVPHLVDNTFGSIWNSVKKSANQFFMRPETWTHIKPSFQKIKPYNKPNEIAKGLPGNFNLVSKAVRFGTKPLKTLQCLKKTPT